MKNLIPSLALFLFACDSDKGLTVFNPSPDAEITSHAADDEVLEGKKITFMGNVSDANHSAGELTATWMLGIETLCEAAPPDPDGTTTCEAVLTSDETEITLEVKDGDNARGEDRVKLVLIPSEVPVADIITPKASDAYYSNQLILFSATINDVEDDTADLIYTWTSSIDGELPISTSPDSSGNIEQYVSLTEGQHSITLTVEDTSGKTTTETVAITVGGPNNDPSCTIAEPVADSVYVKGQSVAFAGTATDDDINNSLLTVSWKSNVDGVFDTSSPFTDGTLGFSTSALSAGNHTISLKVEDEVGAVCSIGTQITIGTPPSLVLNAPSDGGVVGLSESTVFRATVSDQEDIASDISLSWYSDIDGEFSTQGSDSSGNISFSTSALTAGLHNIQVTATDTTGLTATTSFALRVNTAPPAPSIAINPESAFTIDALNVIVTEVADADGDSIAYSYEWFENGVATSYTSTTIPSSETASGEIWKVRVTPNDGYTDGDYAEASVTISNTDPVVNGTIISGGIYNTDVLTCIATGSDVDENLTVEYTWTIDSLEVGIGSTIDLATTAALPADDVLCTASVHDSDGGSAIDTASQTLSNRVPSAPVVSISPTSPTAGADDLVCNITTASTDADGQSVSYIYEWTKDGIPTSYTTNTIPAFEVGDSETWVCTATPDDGIDTGGSGFDSVVSVSACFLTDCDTSIELGSGQGVDFVKIPAGSFVMGSSENETGKLDYMTNEDQHSVALTNDFLVSTTEITQGMFVQLMNYHSHEGLPTSNVFGSLGVGDDYPVYYASWNMAADFSNKLTQKHNALNGTSLQECYSCSGSGTPNVTCSTAIQPIYQCTGYRLLTEAEWEYVARSGSTQGFWTPNGGADLPNGYSDNTIMLTDGFNLSTYGWYYANSTSPYGTKEVATLIPNDFGLYDMVGNVSEWTHDMYTDSLGVDATTDPVQEIGVHRVYRGGFWNDLPEHNRLGRRLGSLPSNNVMFNGIRIGRTNSQ